MKEVEERNKKDQVSLGFSSVIFHCLTPQLTKIDLNYALGAPFRFISTHFTLDLDRCRDFSMDVAKIKLAIKRPMRSGMWHVCLYFEELRKSQSHQKTDALFPLCKVTAGETLVCIGSSHWPSHSLYKLDIQALCFI